MPRFPLPSTIATTLLMLSLATSAEIAPSAQAQSGQLTARQAIEQIIKATGATAPANTVDTIKAGDPETVITGIVTTFLPTMTVLQKAVASNKNLIVTHEPTFYNHLDDPKMFLDDPVYQQKLAYIHEHHLVVWRFHDTWHLRRPDGIAQGFVARLGWQKYQNPVPAGEEGFAFTLPRTTLRQLAQDLQQRFHARSIRIIGDPDLSVSKIAYKPGSSGEAAHVAVLERPDVDVLIAGEARIRPRRPAAGPPQSPHPPRPRHLGRGWHEHVRLLASHSVPRPANRIHPRRRTLLDPAKASVATARQTLNRNPPKSRPRQVSQLRTI